METRAPNDLNRFAQRLFTPLPARYDRLAEVLSMGQNGRWRRAMIDHIVPEHPALVLDVACGPGGVSLQLAERTRADVVGVDLTIEMLRQGQRNVAERAMGDRVRLIAGRGEQLPFAGRDLRRAHLHLPAALRRRSRGDAARAGPGGEARRGGGEPGVPAPAEPLLAVLVVGLHQADPPCRRAPHWGQGMVHGGPVPRTQHLGALPALSARLDGRGVVPGPGSSTSACGG